MIDNILKSNLYPDYLWWVQPQRLGGMPRLSLEELPHLYQAGIRGIVSVKYLTHFVKRHAIVGTYLK
ncbi:MAG: hypothetical protein QNJ65_20710 [Xenococcaceae cyanobacterium MO_234.B1]|nr:hypothetical protein [Xenococcaceae cyanobacterium MO_234.B1]